MDVLSNVEIGLITSLLIFILALFFSAKRWISMAVTLLLLLVSLAAGFIIAHQNIFYDCFSQKSKKQMEFEEKMNNFQEKVLQGQDDLKKEIDLLKKKVEKQEELDDALPAAP